MFWLLTRGTTEAKIPTYSIPRTEAVRVQWDSKEYLELQPNTQADTRRSFKKGRRPGMKETDRGNEFENDKPMTRPLLAVPGRLLISMIFTLNYEG